jgi:soluble lytic murein transglycosylase-like protein
MIEAARPAPVFESSATRSGTRSGRKRRGLFRRAGIIPPAIGVAAFLVAVVYLASYLTTSNGSGAASIFGAIDGLGHSKYAALIVQEKMTIVEMSNAADTLTVDAKPAMANPTQLLQQQQQAAAEETGGTGVTTTPPPADPTAAQADAKTLMASYGWDNTTQYTCLYDLWEQESGWNVYAENTSSGAYGIPQSLPADKMAMFGSDYLTDPVTQIKWGLYYINTTYGTPCAAWTNEVDYGYY